MNGIVTVGANIYAKDPASGSCYGIPARNVPYIAVGGRAHATPRHRAHGVADAPPNPDPDNHYALGAEISAASFDEPTVMSSGSGRLVPREFVTADGFHQFRGSFFDQQLGDSCHFKVAADMQVRCVPLEGVALDTTSIAYFNVGPEIAPTSLALATPLTE